jgi:hypothetical protein
VGPKFNGILQLLAYADNMNLKGDNIKTIKTISRMEVKIRNI